MSFNIYSLEGNTTDIAITSEIVLFNKLSSKQSLTNETKEVFRL